MEVCSAVDAGAADGVGTRMASEVVFGFPNGTVQRRTPDKDAFWCTIRGIVGECSVCHDSKAEGLCVLLEEGCCVAGFGFDDFLTPILPVLCCWGKESIYFGFAKMLDAEWEQKPLRVTTVEVGNVRNECLPGYVAVDRGYRVARVDMT